MLIVFATNLLWSSQSYKFAQTKEWFTPFFSTFLIACVQPPFIEKKLEGVGGDSCIQAIWVTSPLEKTLASLTWKKLSPGVQTVDWPRTIVFRVRKQWNYCSHITHLHGESNSPQSILHWLEAALEAALPGTQFSEFWNLHSKQAIFAPRIFRPDLFTDWEDSGRGIATVPDRCLDNG